MFPEGGPGVALLLLRVSVAVTFFLGAADGRIASDARWVMPCAAVAAILLAFGFLTPVLGVVIVFFQVADFFVTGTLNLLPAILTIVNVLALALLGPGAYSLDARIFGRRVLLASTDDR
jgi:hypothetical protein